MRGEGFPKSVPDYTFHPSALELDPPITPHEFNKRFYSCRQASSWHKWNPLHSCRKPCRSDQAVSRIPKRTTALEVNGDAREIFYGLYARERPSVLAFCLWNLIVFILPGLIFSIIWLKKHPGDVQDAYTPLAICVSLMSCGWATAWAARSIGVA